MRTNSFGALYHDGYSFDTTSEDDDRDFEDFPTPEGEDEEYYQDPEVALILAEASSEAGGNLFEEMMDEL